MRQPESRQDIIVVSVSKEHILAFIVYFYSTLQIKVQVTFQGMGKMLQLNRWWLKPLCQFWSFDKGYNTRESIRANSLAINLAFSSVCGLFEDKIYQLINAVKIVLSEFLFIQN